MKIGELSKLTGVSVRSLRYYEQQGLITPTRLENGYREYHKFTVEEVNTIKFYLSLGLSTDQISSFLHCVLKNNETFCTEVLPIYKEKLEEIDKQIQMLTNIKSNLEERIRSFNVEIYNKKELEHDHEKYS
ncbi:MerR family transcriptional regulator [Chengkuizengella axinellae]|uniref:MerR family transcriptional regulator n=1 Tax=Chengkuizengella axinellae TaxID=3064388 RepID=A0ABT9IX37_9BACL|nr:MerR family transcriptional regulator [Chengkuizengella sp. 2205SS18-9]MDP5273934.1 MerR family transcriptional regulator [Chengkuizengella sp. 2205SS18-9]